ncbi:MAG TPA: bifunctional adenosylcobinamide kinase/adenosylcobinamide-phosphate guanylyltransferase [Acidimicrobiales bacterium]
MRAPTGSTLLIGGARCGKSALAVRLALAWGGPVTFVATAEVADDDFAARVRRHRADRPSTWPTVEEPREVAAAVRDVDPEHLVLVDCISLWVSALMADGIDEDGAVAAADDLADAFAARRAPVLVVTNEVGMGVHPSTSLGREYRDVLGRVNRRLAERVDRALLVVAGRVLPLLSQEDA